MNLVVACCRDFHFEGYVLYGECSEMPWDEPEAGCPTDHSSIDINSSNGQNEGVCVGLERKVSNSEAINTVRVNLVDLNIVKF